jgi:hypothetical protein
VERLQRTIKDRLYRHFTHTSSYRYIDDLQNLTNAYNDSVHSTTKVAPPDVSEQCQEEIWNNQYNDDSDVFDKRMYSSRLDVDDLVRVSRLKKTFEKGSVQNWSEELFRVKKVLPTKPLTYSLVDLADEAVVGSWYTWELQKVHKTNDLFKVEKVIKTRKLKNGQVKYFVKFLGYDSSFNAWVDDITDYNN